jgi:hypothetical protein
MFITKVVTSQWERGMCYLFTATTSIWKIYVDAFNIVHSMWTVFRTDYHRAETTHWFWIHKGVYVDESEQIYSYGPVDDIGE